MLRLFCCPCGGGKADVVVPSVPSKEEARKWRESLREAGERAKASSAAASRRTSSVNDEKPASPKPQSG
jgi:hypothetical protein